MIKNTFLTRRQFLFITMLFLIWREILFGIGAASDRVLLYSPSFPYADTALMKSHFPKWVYSWGNFDGVHYITIAENGYVGTGLIQAFFPLLPYALLHTMRTLYGAGFSALLIGIVISNVSAYFLAIFWFGFVKSHSNERAAWVALLSLFLFPSALFLGALYTESLFLLLVLLAFWFARQKNWLVVAIVVSLASAARVVGIFLVPALLFDLVFENLSHPKKTYYLHHSSELIQEIVTIIKKNWLACLAICSGSVGLLIYMSFLNGEFHDPLYFAHVQKAFGGGREETLILYPQVVWRATKILITSRPFDLRYLTSVQEFLAGTLGLCALLWSLKSVRLSYVLFALAAFLLPTTTGTFSSMSRYLLVCFPVFMMIGKSSQKNPWRVILWLCFSATLLIINTVMFVQGYWVA